MKIKEMHFSCKPSYKLINKGSKYLDTAELLAIVIGNGVKHQSSLEISHKLLKKYNLNGISQLNFNELRKELDHVKALRILSLIELCKRYNKLISKGYSKEINSPEDIFNIYKYRFVDAKEEHFIVVLLDTKNRIIKDKEISVGTLNACVIHPREVFKEAIKESANSIILVHNHPSGDCSPSDEDLEITEKLKEAGEVLDIKLLDHVIVGKEKFWSWGES
ncbi:DNA repair protein RadC [archaeon]|jgi:DNA repair protein RadC|nr:DNA repair protein RadC [archaeon]MBT4397123.1 DNA repair protein RadC [archaeon]MBT4441571.1 DNA repair protein RadC [archaeon]